jgi:hypothetical protein
MQENLKSKTFSSKNVLQWSLFSILNYISIILLIYLYVSIGKLGKLQLVDRFNISDNNLLKAFDLIIFAPMLETAALIFSIALVKKYSKFNFLNYVTVSILFGLLHLLFGSITIAILVIATFQMQLLYLYIRSTYVNFKVIWIEGSIIHCMHNFFIYMISYLKILN